MSIALTKWQRLFILPAVLLCLITVQLLTTQKTQAAYQDGLLIDDALFLDAKSMSAGQIQSFLQTKSGQLKSKSFKFDCDAPGIGSTSKSLYLAAGAPCGSTVPASQIIYYAAQIYGISPKVIISTMQKEQSLITNPSPGNWEFNQAMGYNCPTSGHCDDNSGFFFQIDNGTWVLRYHYERARKNNTWWNTSSDWTCGTAKPSFYTPNLYPHQNVNFVDPYSGIQYKTVYIQNAATSAFYCYTPHVFNNHSNSPHPNDAKPCYSIHPISGNKGRCYTGSINFVKSYELWFGPTVGKSYRFERLSGAPPALNPNDSTDLGSNTTTVIRGKSIHTFYYDATYKQLRHARWNGSKWLDEVLDGQNSSIPGSTSNDVGNGLTATTYGAGGLQLFYRDSTGGNLRHAWWSDAAGKWRFETFDGTAGSVGRLNANLGQDPTVITYKEGLQLFYHDSTNGNLRHAWWSDAAGKWRFETFDGTAGSVGKLDAVVGRDPEILEYHGGLQLFYHDSTNGNLRHAWWSDAAGKWRFETFDGTAGSVGKLDANVGRYSDLALFNGGLQLFYYDSTNGNLRHAWWSDAAGKWRFETFDGTAGSVGGRDEHVGRLPVVQEMDGDLYVFYYNSTARAWEGAYYHRSWYNFTLDGSEAALSRSDLPVGGQLSAAVYQGKSLQIFYSDSAGGLQHSWAR